MRVLCVCITKLQPGVDLLLRSGRAAGYAEGADEGVC